MQPEQFNTLLSQFFPGVVGLQVTAVEPGYSEVVVDIQPRLMNPGGILHGGVAFTLADTGMGVALIASSDPGAKPATIDMSITYYKPATSGKLLCKTRIVRRTKRLAFLESEIFNDTDEPLAKASASFYVPEPA